MIRTIGSEHEIDRFMKRLRRRAEGVSDEIVRSVSSILANVRISGDRALREYTRRFDKVNLEHVRIEPGEIEECSSRARPEVVDALKLAAERIRRFHRRQMEGSWTFRERGTVLGQIVRPLHRVGVYVPGGIASYPSTVLMNVVPAQVAGVKEIALCVPTPRGEIDPSVMAAIRLVGVTEVYRIGGAQAVGAMAFGTETVRRVDKIVGPGNVYVATAKRMVFGIVDIDMIAGPSEVLIIADRTAPPQFVAADLLSQAEHDELASSVLITTSPVLARKVKRELTAQLRVLERKNIARSSLKHYGAIITTKTLRVAVELANRIAPEHLQIMTADPERLVPLIQNAGAVFLGKWTPEPLGDYAAGPNHTLPTGGTSRFFSPLGVYDFFKRSSLLQFDRKAFERLAPTVEILSEIEGLGAHGHTIRIRKEKRKRKNDV